MLLFLLVTAVAFALRFLMQYTFALLAFWRERAHALEQFSLLCYLFLFGLIAPLEVFPPLVREIAQWTPYGHRFLTWCISPWHFSSICLPIQYVGD